MYVLSVVSSSLSSLFKRSPSFFLPFTAMCDSDFGVQANKIKKMDIICEDQLAIEIGKISHQQARIVNPASLFFLHQIADYYVTSLWFNISSRHESN